MAYYECSGSIEKSVEISAYAWINYSQSDPSNCSCSITLYVDGEQVGYNSGHGSEYWTSYTINE